MEIVSGIATKILELLAVNVYSEISLARRVEDELNNLQGRERRIRAILLDAEKKQVHSHEMSEWLDKLRDALSDTEELLLEFEYKHLRKQVMLHGCRSGRMFCHFFSRSNPLGFSFSNGRKLKKMQNKLDGLLAEKTGLGLVERPETEQIISKRDVIFFNDRASDVIGREKDKAEVIRLLMEPCDEPNVPVIPILGIGGLGKTTLARLVYEDEGVRSHFGLRMWVRSENLDRQRLFKDILKSARVDEDIYSDELQGRLKDKLAAQRFLLILDDVWSDSPERRLDLRKLLMVGSEGSKIIVTTRKRSVAELMGTRRSNGKPSTYELRGLPPKDCLSLFIKWAFKDGDDDQHPNLVKIAEQIVAKCKGLPLAVTTLGSLLFSKLDEREWNYIKANEIWQLEQEERSVLHALQLSYNELPSPLKRCFHYFSLFPKGIRFSSWDLIQLWMSKGLLVQPEGHRNKSFEEIGEWYFEQLRSRSFFEDVEEFYDCNRYYAFSMHDLIHDLAQLMSKNECSIVTSPTENVPERVRHLSITCSCDEELACLDKLKSVHTIIASNLSTPSFIEKYILKFKFLRVLGLSHSSFEVLPSDIGRMKHLRYLDLRSNTKIRKLPSSICKLHSLQSLLLGGCTSLIGLPRGINCLISLRVLIITTTAKSLPEMECLTSLRDLRLWRCPNLISLPHSVRRLAALETLFIFGCGMLTLKEDEDNDQVSELISLRNLLLEDLPKLVALPQWLRGCEGSLQFFAVASCLSFKELPQWLPNMTSLQNLRLIDCPELQLLPAKEMHRLTSLQKLNIRGCPNLRNSIEAMNGEWLRKIDFQCHFSEKDEEMDYSEAEGDEEFEQDFTVGPSFSKLEIEEHSRES